MNAHFRVRTTHEDFQSSTKILSQGNYIFNSEINFTICTTLTLRLLMSPAEIVGSNPTVGMDICLL